MISNICSLNRKNTSSESAKPNNGITRLKKYNCPFSLIAGKKRTNVLGIPKVECVDFEDFISRSNEKNVYSFFKKVNEVINLLGINKRGYRIITNSGEDGGQEVPHFHIHIIGGEKLGTKIK